MKLARTLAVAALLTGSVKALELKAEHAGGVINRVHGGGHFVDDGVINSGTPSGQTVSLGNGMILSAEPQRPYAHVSDARRNWIHHVPSSSSG